VHEITLDAASPGRAFEGIGAVSAGGSSRLLPDYPEPQRAQILDFLFKPRFGAGFQHLKVEVGCGENSTSGSEPSHAVIRGELLNPKPRGYELWLMAEARKRNPKIFLDCLPWSYPAWVRERFSQASAEWLASFLTVCQKHYGIELDWLTAAQNEMGTDLHWIRTQLRPQLDKHGFGHVKISAPDGDSSTWAIFDQFENDRDGAQLISAVGYHYLDGREPWNIDQQVGHPATAKAKQSGKSLWASEEWSQCGASWDGQGALYLARLMNKLYTRDRVTKFEIWCPVAGIYDQTAWARTGVMRTNTPWCGSYTVWPAVWAVAHTTQFAEPTWIYMDEACAQIDRDTWRGSHVALRNPETGDWSLIVCTGRRTRLKVSVGNNLKSGAAYLWRSTADEQFVQLPPAKLTGGTEIDLEPDAVYTLTSTTGQRKGTHDVPPRQQAFPFPFTDSFESYRPGDTPRYFADQKGTFEIVSKPGSGQCLGQIVPAQGLLWFDTALLKPHTVFGDGNWRDSVVEADVLIAGGDVEIGGRFGHRDYLGYRLILASDGQWQLNWQLKTLESGRIVSFDNSMWHRLRLSMKGSNIDAVIDGVSVASLTDASGTQGMAFLGSSYHFNLFDNVRVSPVVRKPDAMVGRWLPPARRL